MAELAREPPAQVPPQYDQAGGLGGGVRRYKACGTGREGRRCSRPAGAILVLLPRALPHPREHLPSFGAKLSRPATDQI